jgi:hypothetical protein
MKSRAPQGRRLGDKRLEVVEAADVILHVAGHWAAVEGIQEDRKGGSKVGWLNKYNTNYEVLRLADSTALAFSLGKVLLKLITTSGWITITHIT